MKLYLIGYMGCGKSVTGKKLASLLKLPFSDMDEIITTESKLSIGDIFRKKGELFFRKTERKCLKKILLKKNAVVATGGGTPCFFNNMALMNRNGITFYIRLNFETLVNRIVSNPNERPLLEGLRQKEIELFTRKMLPEREKYYLQAKYIIEAEGKRVNELCAEIIKCILPTEQ